jgi:ATP-independent RNA helicase DbpA
MKTADILSRLNIESLNAMQKESFDAISKSENDVVLLSPTGTGKTLAYLLPFVERIDVKSDEVQMVVLVPGRELAKQSDSVLKSMHCGVRSMCCYGGRPAMDEHRRLRAEMPQVIFATPGRLNDHLTKGNIDATAIHWLVIDEFDKCLEMGFQDEMRQVITKLPALQQRVLLSATDCEEIPSFVRVNGGKRIDFISGNENPDHRVTLYTVKSPEKDKLNTLDRLLRSFGSKSSIVFLSYRDSVERVAGFLTFKGYVVSGFHGGLDQQQRERALYKFSNGSANVLVATDLASRGLDIPDVYAIVHYHLPLSRDEYIHRVGRTARWDATGNAYFILGPEEHMPDFIKDDTENFDLPEETGAQNMQMAAPLMSTLYIGKGKKDKISKGDIVGFLCKEGNLAASEIGRIDVMERYSYVAVPRLKSTALINSLKGKKIKGIKTIIENVV